MEGIEDMATQFSSSIAPWRPSRATSQLLSGYPPPRPHKSISELDPAMASATSPTIDELVQAIKTDGFLFLKDAAKGVQAEEFGRKQFPITTNEGIDFCKAHTFRDPRITGILESVFGFSCLGMFTVLHPFPGCAHNFFIDKSELQGLMIQIWRRGSQAIYYKKSHHLPLRPSTTHDGMFEIPHEQLAQGSDPITVNIEEGGLVVLDPRLGFTVFKGFAVTFVFAVRELTDKWSKMRLPHSPELERKVAEINSLSPNIGTNFIFQS